MKRTKPINVRLSVSTVAVLCVVHRPYYSVLCTSCVLLNIQHAAASRRLNTEKCAHKDCVRVSLLPQAQLVPPNVLLKTSPCKMQNMLI